LQLSTPLQFNEKVQPIALSDTEVPLDAKLQMVGWMVTDRQGKKTANLKQITLTTIDSQKCQPFHEKQLSKSEFCTVVTENNYCKVRRKHNKNIIKNIILKKRYIFVSFYVFSDLSLYYKYFNKYFSYYYFLLFVIINN